MAYSDYDVDQAYNDAAIVGGDDGVLKTHASLASPLTLQGTECREFKVTTPNNGRAYNFFAVKSASEPLLTSIPSTKAIQTEMWFRIPMWLGGAGGGCVSLHAKSSLVAGATQLPPGVALYAGYGNLISNGSSPFGTYALGLALTNTSFATTWYPSLLAISFDTWYQIRLEVTPVLNGTVDRDLIETFWNSGTEASPVWTKLSSQINIAADNRWTPWGNATYTRCGFGVQVSVGASGEDHLVYTDSHIVRLKDV